MALSVNIWAFFQGHPFFSLNGPKLFLIFDKFFKRENKKYTSNSIQGESNQIRVFVH